MKLKKCKVVMLPSNDEAVINPGDLFKSVRGFIGLWLVNVKENTYHPECKKQHLYILSDDKIKVGDCVLNIVQKTAFKASEQLVKLINSPNVDLTTNKKIIATTDKSLKLPAISKGFIEKYVEKGGIDEVMVKYEDDIPVIRNNKISIRPVVSDRTTQMNLENVRFGYPMVHDAPLNTWCSSVFVEVNGYIVSFAGDDGNRGKKGEKSIRHYLSISKGNHDLTEELGFKTQDVTFLDFVNAIKKVESL